MGRTKKGRGKKKRGGGKKPSSKPIARNNDAEDLGGDDVKSLSGDVNAPPSLDVGARVEVSLLGTGDHYTLGTVTGRWIKDVGHANPLVRDRVVPFRVRLDGGRSVGVPSESEKFIRKSDEPPFQIVHKMGSRVYCLGGGGGEWVQGTIVATNDDWAEKDTAPYVIHIDYEGRDALDAYDDGHMSTRFWWGHEECIRKISLSTAPSTGLRFKLGDRVCCHVEPGDDGWMPGTIIKLWYQETASVIFPYQVQLDCGRRIMAPEDVDDCVVKSTAPPPECWICLDNEQSEGNLIVRDCACRGGRNGFVHVECLVKLAQTKVEGNALTPGGMNPFTQCITCQRKFDAGSPSSRALRKAFFETFKDREVDHYWNNEATTYFVEMLAQEGEYVQASSLLNGRISDIRFEISKGKRASEEVTLLKIYLARSLLSLAEVYDGMGNLRAVKTVLDESLSVWETVDSLRGWGRTQVMGLMARYSYKIGDKNAALEYLEYATQHAEDGTYITLLKCGKLNLELGNKERGLDQISRAVRTMTTLYGAENNRVRVANKCVRKIELGLMDKWPTYYDLF